MRKRQQLADGVGAGTGHRRNASQSQQIGQFLPGCTQTAHIRGSYSKLTVQVAFPAQVDDIEKSSSKLRQDPPDGFSDDSGRAAGFRQRSAGPVCLPAKSGRSARALFAAPSPLELPGRSVSRRGRPLPAGRCFNGFREIAADLGWRRG